MPKETVLKALADNQLLCEALKELITSKFSVDQVSLEQSNEAMGEIIRARLTCLKKINEVFTEIEAYKTLAEENPILNPAR